MKQPRPVSALRIEGAAEGILAASVLNAIVSRSKVITTFSVHTLDAEGFVLHSELTPQDRRIRLSEVFVRMRQATHNRTHDASSDP